MIAEMYCEIDFDSALCCLPIVNTQSASLLLLKYALFVHCIVGKHHRDTKQSGKCIQTVYKDSICVYGLMLVHMILYLHDTTCKRVLIPPETLAISGTASIDRTVFVYHTHANTHFDAKRSAMFCTAGHPKSLRVLLCILLHYLVCVYP